MPFTPLHMGPAIAVKALAPRHFSLITFGGAQVLMDLQPLWAMLSGQGSLHGWTHSYPGALLIALVAMALARPGVGWMQRLLRMPVTPLRWRLIIASALIGTLSHVALDSLMHADLQPGWPWWRANPWLGAISIEELHLACVGSALAGAVLYFIRCGWRELMDH